MLKKMLVIFVLSFSILSANAIDFNNIDYKNIKESSKITFTDGVWSQKVNKKRDVYFVKKVSAGTGSYSEFYTSDGDFLFSTGTQYEFLKDGKLIGYSNPDLKFYEFYLNNNFLEKRELTEVEINELFKNFHIIRISDFSKSTNALKIKKTHKNYKIILLNDTDRYFYNYNFTSGNAKFEQYYLKGFLNIKKGGMIQFSHFGDDTKENPCYILLVR